MTRAVTIPGAALYYAKNRFLATVKKEGSAGISWIRVIKLPAFTLLLVVFGGLSVAGHTYYVETETKRSIAQTDQLVAGILQARSTTDVTDL